PAIRRAMERQVGEVDPAACSGVLLDAALLQEAGWDAVCDAVVFIDVAPALRFERVQQQRGWSRAELSAREQSQWSLERKQGAATHTVGNGGSLETAGRELWEILSGLHIAGT
ncbi:MAG: hypothetical protein B7Z55_18300, partial [Planctomycetales bacterium 12-60-4]